MTLQQLLEKRAAKMSEAMAIVKAGQLDETQQKRFDTLDAEITDLDKQITRARKIAEWERQQNATPLTDGGRDTLETETRKASLLNFIRLGIPGATEGGDLGREREIHSELAKRSAKPTQGILVPMSIFHEKRTIVGAGVSPVSGGNLIGTDHRGDLYVDLLRAKLITAQRGATVLSGLVGNVEIPGGQSFATAGWIAENSALTPSDPQFKKAVTLTPKTVGALTEYSRNMILQSSPDVEQLVRNDFSAVLAQTMDTAALQGGGANEPSGILDNDILTSDMTTPTLEKVLQMIEKVETQNADVGALGWACHPSLRRKLRSTLKAEDSAAGFIMDTPDQLAGYGLSTSTTMPTSGLTDSPPAPKATLLFGNFNDLLLGYWSSFEILVNPYEGTAYSKGNVQVRGLITMDAAVRRTESFVAAANVSTALSG